MFKRLPFIRHIRWMFLSWWLEWHVYRCQRLGYGWFAQEGDLQYLQDVWDGKQ